MLMLLNCGVGEDSWESLELQGDPTSQSKRKSVLNVYWKDWCWSWNSSTLATWCEELTHLKRPWCWERLKVGEEGDDRGWDGWIALPTQWTWVWVNSGSWWWRGKPGMLQSVGSQRVRHDWTTEMTELSTLHVECGSFSMCAQLLSHVWLFATLWTVAHPAPLSMEFYRQAYWSELPCPPPGDLLDPGIGPRSSVSPALAGRFFTTEPPMKQLYYVSL